MRVHLSQKGFTLIELILTIGIMVTLLTITTFNLLGSQQKASVSSTVNVLVADLKEQQLKAMVGDTESRTSADSYGIKFFTDRYVLFHGGTYSSSDPDNFTVRLEGTLQFTTTLPDNQVVFTKGSGEIEGYTAGNDNITLQSPSQAEQRTLYLNKPGVVINML